MKQVAACLVLVFAGALVVGTSINAGEKKDKTLKGTITCAKCDLKVEGVKKCATVIVVKNKKGEEVVYYFDPAGHKKYHSDVCQTPKKGTVTGTTSKKDDKRYVKVKSLDYE